ncbi:hypothetical protein [Agathobaculum desmolans]|uniref:hypothetical protein n=1 Tax=Agathobaculum desmolans TaxID=39484 RepID=UPI000990851F|nr:hypothetical protein [Agathobaculum desmolans]
MPTSDSDIFPFIPYKPTKGENDGLSGRNFSGGLVFPDNKAFGKLRSARCLIENGNFPLFTYQY